MVEVLTSALLLAPYGPGVGPLTSSAPKGAAEISQFFMVLNPGRFGEYSDFVDHVNNLCSDLRNLRPSDPSAPVLVPGDPEDEMYSRNFVQGIPVHSSVLDSLNELASRVGVPHLGSRDMPFADVEERP
jgi:LDH2 family malate/lactate/ureidoglycolate dehydrogenase